MGDSEKGAAEKFWVDGVVLGDFSEEESWWKITGQVLVGLVPYAGQVADIRDIAANIKGVSEGKEGAWLNLGLAGIGIIPLFGDLAKGGVRLGRQAAKEATQASIEAAQATARAARAAAARSARYLGDMKKWPIPAGMRKEFDDLLARRELARAQRDVLEGKKAAGTLTADEAKQLSTARGQVNEASRLLGEKAGDTYMAAHFPGAEKMYPAAGAGSRSGDFDQIWRTSDGKYVVVEAKGGGSGLGERTVAAGHRAQQGSSDYFDDIVRNMGGSRAGADAADELLAARAAGNVQYLEVRAPIGTKGGAPALRDIEVSEFNLSRP